MYAKNVLNKFKGNNGSKGGTKSKLVGEEGLTYASGLGTGDDELQSFRCPVDSVVRPLVCPCHQGKREYLRSSWPRTKI